MLTHFIGQGFRPPATLYPSGDYGLKYDAIVVEVTKATVTVLGYGLDGAYMKSMLVEAFTAEYHPDFSIQPSSLAKVILGSRTFMKVTEAMRTALGRYVDQPLDPERRVQGDPVTENCYVVCKEPSSGRTCLVTWRDQYVVQYIPLDPSGFDVYETQVKKFDQSYKPMPDYPPERAARLYASYALNLGATKEALNRLRNFTPISDKEYTMAVTKKDTKDAGKTAATKLVGTDTGTKTTPPPTAVKAAKKGAAAAAPKLEKAKPVKAAAAKADEKPAKEKAIKAKAERQPSAASRFADLLREGKYSDDKIFAIVQKEYQLPDSRRGYVNWYRNHLRKRGETIKDPIGE